MWVGPSGLLLVVLNGWHKVRDHEGPNREQSQQSRREQAIHRPKGADVAQGGHTSCHCSNGDHLWAVDAPVRPNALDTGQVDGQVRCDTNVDPRAAERYFEKAPIDTARISDGISLSPDSQK